MPKMVHAFGVVALTAGCSATGQSTVKAELSDRYPSTTASDWVTYGDFVAVVRVAEDSRAELSAEVRERREGNIDRAVKLAIDEVVWQKQGSRRPPTTIVYPATGWHLREGVEIDDAAELVPDDRPRFEGGHRYVVTFAWQPPRCYVGDGARPARWVGLGSGSSLPFDGDVLGVGEFAGEPRDLKAAEEHSATLPGDSVAAQVTGEHIDVLAQLLADAKPEPKGDYEPSDSTC